MSIVLKTHKMLWGRSGNLCAFPECKKELVMDISETDDISVVGEEAQAANYVFDKIRQHLLPSFRIKEGVLLVEIGPWKDMSWRILRVEYKQVERTEFPYPGLRKFMEVRNDRDISWGEGVSEDYFEPVLD